MADRDIVSWEWVLKWARQQLSKGCLRRPLPQCKPGPAERPSLSPEGRKKERERALRSLERDVWARAGTAVVLCHQSEAWGEVGTLRGQFCIP